MRGHAANGTHIADTSNRTAEYSTCAIDVYNRSRTSEGRSPSLISIGRTYHRVDYRVQTLVRTSASITANNSASNCADGTDTGSGDRSASPPICAGVRVVVLARVLSENANRIVQYEPLPEYAAAIGIQAWLLFSVYAEQPGCFEATVLDKPHSRIWTMPNLWSTIQASRKIGPFLPGIVDDVAGATAFGRASVILISRSVSPVCERWFLCRKIMRVRQGGTGWHRRLRAHRPGHAHAEVVGVLVLALTSVPHERAALLREEAATTHARGSASAAQENRPAAVRTRVRRCAFRGATAALGPQADFQTAPCSATAPAQAC
jgi:hypothetical protein